MGIRLPKRLGPNHNEPITSTMLMKKQKLKAGDVFELKNGMKVIAARPARFVNPNCPGSMDPIQAETIVGLTYHPAARIGYASPSQLASSFATTAAIHGFAVDATKFQKLLEQHAGLEHRLPNEFTAHLEGHYVVIDTANPNTNSPVTAKRLNQGQFDPHGTEITLGQSDNHITIKRTLPPPKLNHT